jgi:hypothetical protein
MKNINKYKYFILFSSLCFFSLIISFFLNEDGHGNGASGDFRDTWGYIQELKIKSLFDVNPIQWTRHFPIHYYILSFFSNFITNKEFLRFAFCSASILIPFFFYKIFFLKNKTADTKIAIILSSIIFFIPAFRYLSIWANAHITANVFFLCSIFFLTKYQESKINKNTNLFLHIFFIFLATYTIQYYVIFIAFFFAFYFSFKISKKNFFTIIIIIIFSLPGFFFTYRFSDHFNSINTNFYFSNTILSNTAMLAIYLAPIIFINYLYNKKIYYNKSCLISFVISFIIIFICARHFQPEKWIVGGGVPFAISNILFNNFYFFYACSFIGIFALILFSQENFNNLALSLICIFVFSSNALYQRYYEPLFHILFFLLFNTKYLIIFKKKIICTLLLILYYFIYYLTASSEILYLFK